MNIYFGSLDYYSILIVEIIPAIGNFVFLLFKYFKNKHTKDVKLEYYPEITIIIPIYNSETTLHKCIKSINDLLIIMN